MSEFIGFYFRGIPCKYRVLKSNAMEVRMKWLENSGLKFWKPATPLIVAHAKALKDDDGAQTQKLHSQVVSHHH